jgi:hypothetical protein
MPIQYLETKICLPPGPVASTTVEAFFRRVFEEYLWFRPMRFGGASLNKVLTPKHIDYAALLDHYERVHSITVAARTDRDFFLFSCATSMEFPYVGRITWLTSAKLGAKPAWRQAHQRQVLELMRLLDSPLAVSALDTDIENKTQRWVPNPDGFGSELTSTVRGYGEGLPGVFWRNFYGPLFVRMFGERLDAVPAELKENLGDGIVLVQPYELPTQAGTPDGIERERQLIALLGPECFYDHERHVKPTHVPDLPAPIFH